MITEHLMRPGNGSVRFTPSIPLTVTNEIRQLVDEDAGGEGASLVVTKVRVDPDQIGDTATLAAALYSGPIVDRPSRLSLNVTGLSTWLDTYFDSDITRTTGTPSQWVGDLLANGLSSGTVTATGLSNITRTFLAHSATRRECLDAWASLAGAEYRVNPDLTVDVAAYDTLFQSPPQAVVTKHDDGPDGKYRGVDGSLLDQALTRLGPNIATKAVALAEGDGTTLNKGTATRSISLKTPTGGTPTIIRVLSAPSESSSNANTLASNFLNLQGMRRQVNVSTRSYALPRFVKPGDEVYLWDPSAGLYDTSNQIIYRGETIFPVLVRLLSYTWPIERGYGVYVRPNASSPTYIDVTDWVEWEDGNDSWWTVGDWDPPTFGPTNRSNPSIEQRLAGNGFGFGSFSGTTNASSQLVVTHNLGWTPSVVIVQPGTPNGASTNDRFVSANVTNISSTTFTIGRCVSQDGSLFLSSAVTGYWAAFA